MAKIILNTLTLSMLGILFIKTISDFLELQPNYRMLLSVLGGVLTFLLYVGPAMDALYKKESKDNG